MGVLVVVVEGGEGGGRAVVSLLPSLVDLGLLYVGVDADGCDLLSLLSLWWWLWL